VNFAFSDEQEELRRTIRRFLAATSPEAEVRRVSSTLDGYEPSVWRRLSDQLGVQALAVPEAYGGAGFTFLELGLALQEAGRALLPAPLLSTAFAVATLLCVDDEQARGDYLPGIATGELLATTALGEGVATSAASVQASPAAAGWRLEGQAGLVVDGNAAALLLVPARVEDGIALFALVGDAAGVKRSMAEVLDTTRRLAHVTLTDAPARRLGSRAQPWTGLEQAVDLASIMLAAETLGVAERCLDMAVDYAKVREQFGRPIGSFQAIKHLLADVLIEVEAARSAVWYALWQSSVGHDIRTVASLALATGSEAAYLAASVNLQVHGGLGITWEHPAQLFLKRATTSRLLLGDPSAHRERMLRALSY